MEYICPIRGFTIQLNLDREKELNDAAKITVSDRYSRNGEKTAQESFARASCAFADNQEHAQRLYDYCSKLWFMYASPLLSNGGTNAGQPISCFLSSVGDTIKDIISNHEENAYLSVYGGGIGTDWSSVRSKGMLVKRGGETPGVIPFIKVVDSQVNAFQQGSTRRGSAAVYLDISHPEIEEFIDIRDHVGGDEARKCLNTGFHHGVNVPDEFLNAVKQGSKWALIDPHTKQVIQEVDARELWKKLLKSRVERGEPYIHFTTTSNAKLPQALKDKGLRIRGSNLCNEIYLPTSPERTAVCCLSSVNLDKFYEWASEADQFIEDLMRMLDNALTVFIETAPKEMWRAVASAKSERSIGLGAMGFHSMLQGLGVAFGSEEASLNNKIVFSTIKKAVDRTNLLLGKERGEAPDMAGTGKRFAHCTAIAPNATSSIICGNTSPSIEPYDSNGYAQITLSGTLTNKNKHLDKVINSKNLTEKEYKDVWSSIITSKGSVQHLDIFTDEEKEVFKTAREIDQSWLIRLACERQQFIDQGQSVNLFVQPDINFTELYKLHMDAWQGGLKGLYYCHSESIGKIKKQESTPSKPTVVCTDEVCTVCEG